MKSLLLRTLALLLFSLAVVTHADGQAARPQRRPVDGRPSERLPRFQSLEAFKASRSAPSALRSSTRQGAAALPAAGIPLAASRSTTVAGGRIDLVRAPNGTIAWMTGRLGEIDLAAGKTGGLASLAAGAATELSRWSGILRLSDPLQELEGVRHETDELGMTHVRFRQVLDGVPVWARELIVHADSRGRIVSMNGSYEPTPARRRARVSLTEREALARVERILTAEGRWNPPSERVRARFGIEGPTVASTWYPTEDGTFVRAWEVSIHPNLVQWVDFIVDAATGDILNRYARHCTILPDDNLGAGVSVESAFSSGIAAPRAGQFVDASAVDLHGQNRQIRVWRENNGTHYKIWDLPNTTPFSLPDVPSVGSALTLTANNNDDFRNAQFVTSANNAWNDPSAVSAHINMKTAYDYFAGTHGRRAINDRDESMISIVHITDNGQSMENAFWTGRIMGYGDGGSYFTPLAGGLDVAAHEMSHGVIEHTANLVYQYQSGALNESMADVFGAFVDRGDYLMGEDLMRPGRGIALRDMENPGNPQLLAEFRQPSHMNEYQNLGANQDNGGVHINSGIPNRAAVLVMKALGYDKAERIYYRALSTYLTRTSQFGDARQALVTSAADLYGTGSSEVVAVQQAFDAVGIGNATQGQGDPAGNEVDPIAGDGYVFFMLQDGSMAYLEMSSGDAYQVPLSTGAVTNGSTQLSTPAGGAAVWYIHSSGQLARLDLATFDNDLFPNLFIQAPGDLWNVAIAPDESVAILTSVYDRDPNLYVTDGVDMAVIELKAQTTQEGILDESIQYPDVISISPNPDQPKLAFDALRAVSAGTDVIQFWSMYEVDLDNGRIYNLLASQPEGISVGNITYSNTDPDLIAFNIFDDAAGEYANIVADMASGDAFLFDTGAVTDAQRPSFSPDDRSVVMSSPGQGQLLFYDGATNELSTVSFGVPVYNPRWFAIGSPATSVDPWEVPAAFAIDSAFPNPFSSSTTVGLAIGRASEVHVAVYDILGREVARLHDGLLTPGEHAFTWSPATLSSGTYLVKVSSGAAVRTRTVVLAR